MKKFFSSIIMIIVALTMTTMVTGCSSSHDDSSEIVNPTTRQWLESATAPAWAVNWYGNTAKPTWNEPNTEDYENWMIIMVHIPDELKPFASADDQMSVFIDDVCRVVSSPAVDSYLPEENQDNDKFLLKIHGNEAADEDKDITLQYYNAKLSQLFVLTKPQTTYTQDIHFVSELVYGVSELFCPDILGGCVSYPVKSDVYVKIPEDVNPKAGDFVAAFVGDECRGVSLVAENSANIRVYGRQEGETVTFKYYSQTQGICSFSNTVTLTKEINIINVQLQ